MNCRVTLFWSKSENGHVIIYFNWCFFCDNWLFCFTSGWQRLFYGWKQFNLLYLNLTKTIFLWQRLIFCHLNKTENFCLCGTIVENHIDLRWSTAWSLCYCCTINVVEYVLTLTCFCHWWSITQLEILWVLHMVPLSVIISWKQKYSISSVASKWIIF